MGRKRRVGGVRVWGGRGEDRVSVGRAKEEEKEDTKNKTISASKRCSQTRNSMGGRESYTKNMPSLVDDAAPNGEWWQRPLVALV